MTLKSAVVGGGDVSTVHLASLARHPEVDLRAICDADEVRAGDRASTYDIRAYGDFEGMLALESLDWVHVCTPTALHFEHARMALEDDLALQIECPLTERAEDGDALANLAAEHDARVSVVHDGVFEPAIQRAEALIQEGSIGSLRAIDLLYTGEPWPHEIGDRDWFADLAGGAFEASLARPISQVIRLGGYPASRSAIAAGGTRRGARDDQFDFDGATFQYTTDDGICCSGTVVASDAPRRIVRIHGDRGSVVVDLNTGAATVNDPGDDSLVATARDTARRLLTTVRDTSSGNIGSPIGSTTHDDAPPRNTHDAQITAEVDAMQDGRPLPVPLESGVWTVRVIEAIRSAASDEEESTVRVAPPIDAA